MSSKTKSAINGNGRTVDINHLQREIQADVATYRQHKAEDGMKKRAIHSSKDYDEFRNFVSVSQLKPTSGRDVSSLFSGSSGTVARGSVRSSTVRGDRGAIGGFDDIIQRRSSSQSTSIANLPSNLQSLSLGNLSKKKLEDKPEKQTRKSSRATYDFLRDWKEHCKTAEDTVSFLTRLNDTSGSFEDKLILQPDLTCKDYFATDIDSDIVGDIVEALHLLVCMKRNDTPPAIANGSTLSNEAEGGCQDTSGIADTLSAEVIDVSFTRSWLKALTSCGRIELSVSFLMPGQQMKLKEICTYLRTSNENEAADDEYLIRYDSLLGVK